MTRAQRWSPGRYLLARLPRVSLIGLALVAAALLSISVGSGDGRAQDGSGETQPPVTAEARIAPGDGLQVLVFNHPELSRSVTVQADGSIAFLPIGRLAVAGQTVQSVAHRIAAGLEAEYKLRDPRVSVAIESSGERAVFILGAVRSSGSHKLPQSRPLTLTQLVALAGGFTTDANLSRIAVQHVGSGQRAQEFIDLSALEQTGFSPNDIALRDGDTVYVPRNPPPPTPGSVSVLGQVGSPGTFVMRPDERMTVLRVISLARGLTRLADRGEVVLIRDTPGARQRIELDVDEIIDGEADDVALQPGDILVVRERGW